MTDRNREEPEEAMSPFSGPRADLGRRAQATDTIIIVAAIRWIVFRPRRARTDKAYPVESG